MFFLEFYCELKVNKPGNIEEAVSPFFSELEYGSRALGQLTGNYVYHNDWI